MRTYRPNRIHSFKCETHIQKEVKITREHYVKRRFTRDYIWAEKTDADNILIVPISIIKNLKPNQPYGFTGEVKEGIYYIDDRHVKLYNAHSVYNDEAYVKVEYGVKVETETSVEYVDITEDRLELENEQGKLDDGMYELCKKFQQLGIKSTNSCNGHNKKKAYIQFSTKTNKNYLIKLLQNEDYIEIINVESDLSKASYIRIEFDFTDENRQKIISIGEKH